ncbi:MAG: hypothetical protein HFI88_09645 [Lachnospiraceae bacterium]|nr:hypothetical protein [Lachnospiraceae bacterium]
MNRIRIAWRLIGRRKWTVFLLAVEIVLSSIVLLGMAGRLLFMRDAIRITETFQGEDAYYFTPRSYYSPDFEVENYLSPPLKDQFEKSAIHTMRFETKEGTVLNAMAYDDLLIGHVKIAMDEGVWFTEYEGEAVPAVAIGGGYGTGEYIGLKNGQSCFVIGVISSDTYVAEFEQSASSGMASLENLVSSNVGYEIIIPYGGSRYGTLRGGAMEERQASEVFMPRDKNVAKALEAELLQYGDVSSVDEMKKNYAADNREFMVTNGIIALVFLVLTVVGIGGLNGIQSLKNAKIYVILYILGFSRRKCMVLEAVNTFAVIGVSYLMFLLADDKIAPLITSVRSGKIHGWMYGGVVLYFTLVYLLTSFSSIRAAARCNVIELYKKEKE